MERDFKIRNNKGFSFRLTPNIIIGAYFGNGNYGDNYNNLDDNDYRLNQTGDEEYREIESFEAEVVIYGNVGSEDLGNITYLVLKGSDIRHDRWQCPYMDCKNFLKLLDICRKVDINKIKETVNIDNGND